MLTTNEFREYLKGVSDNYHNELDAAKEGLKEPGFWQRALEKRNGHDYVITIQAEALKKLSGK